MDVQYFSPIFFWQVCEVSGLVLLIKIALLFENINLNMVFWILLMYMYVPRLLQIEYGSHWTYDNVEFEQHEVDELKGRGVDPWLPGAHHMRLENFRNIQFFLLGMYFANYAPYGIVVPMAS